MTMFAQPMRSEQSVDDELLALAKLEATCNAIRLRISRLAPDQLYRGWPDEPSIAELISAAVDRERAYLSGFRRATTETQPRLEEPRPGLASMDRDFGDDLAIFFDVRRETLDLLRSISEETWQRTVLLPDGGEVTLETLAVRLQHHDAHMLESISRQRHRFLKSTGVDDLRDMGVAGKLGENLAQ
ncbi:MAG TPA: DinB family protein [Herpetosiphonaceae bacterium]